MVATIESINSLNVLNRLVILAVGSAADDSRVPKYFDGELRNPLENEPILQLLKQ